MFYPSEILFCFYHANSINWLKTKYLVFDIFNKDLADFRKNGLPVTGNLFMTLLRQKDFCQKLCTNWMHTGRREAGAGTIL